MISLVYDKQQEINLFDTMRPWITSLTFPPLKLPLKFREISDLRNILWLMTHGSSETCYPGPLGGASGTRVEVWTQRQWEFVASWKDPGNEVWRHESAVQTRTKTSLQQASFSIMRRMYEHEAAPKRGLASQAGHSLHMFSICFWSALRQWVGSSTTFIRSQSMDTYGLNYKTRSVLTRSDSQDHSAPDCVLQWWNLPA